jgi:hypothetical protein
LTDIKLFPRRTNITSTPNSQPIAGVQFEGNISHLLPLSPKARYVPDVSMLRQDGGNTGSTDYAGPIGRNLSVTSTTNRLAPLLFDAERRITAGGIVIEGANLTYTINAIDPETLEILSSEPTPDHTGVQFTDTPHRLARTRQTSHKFRLHPAKDSNSGDYPHNNSRSSLCRPAK